MRYSTDTRTIRPGEVYAAIRGERYDGHDFVAEAVEKGARAVIVEQPVSVPAHVDVIQVTDPIIFLAEEARRKLRARQPAVVAITGSIGKTSTKNAITTVLGGPYSVLATQGNFNTPLGIALTLLNSDFDAETKLVLEMGACRTGDIATLCEFFPPDISVVTNVHGVHLETFGTIENVAYTKGEIVRALPPAGIACLNGDDARVRAMAKESAGQALLYGTAKDCDIHPRLIASSIPLLGDHAIYLALAAFAVGHALGMPHQVINDRLRFLRAEKGRLSKLPGVGGSILIDDSYNASPASTRVALGVLAREPAERRIAFLGDMLELGDASEEAHVQIIEAAARAADHVYLVGSHMHAAYSALPEEALQSVHTFSRSRDVANEMLASSSWKPGPGDVILVKGSQGVRMEYISRALLAPSVDPESVLCRQTKSWRQIQA